MYSQFYIEIDSRILYRTVGIQCSVWNITRDRIMSPGIDATSMVDGRIGMRVGIWLHLGLKIFEARPHINAIAMRPPMPQERKTRVCVDYSLYCTVF